MYVCVCMCVHICVYVCMSVCVLGYLWTWRDVDVDSSAFNLTCSQLVKFIYHFLI